MMLAIDGGGYDTAAEAYLDGNHAAASCYDRLTSALGSYAGMAGDDATSVDFAASYDDAAQQAVHALVDLVGALGNLGAMTEATRANHARAEASSVIAGAVVPAGGVDDAVSGGRRVDVMPCTPPSALGANGYDLPGHVDWILDHIEGFVWPSGDPERLRAAAQDWRDAAGRVDGLRTYCRYGVRGLELERSPEVPMAVAATESLEATIGDLVAQLTAIAGACESYAASVEEKHAQIVDLAEWLLEQFVEGVIISAAIGFLTGGAGAAASMSAVIAKVSAESPRFAALLTALRALAGSAAAELRSTRAAVDASRLRLDRFNRARLRGVRDERLPVEPPTVDPFPPGSLLKHEGARRGHTLDRHVGKTREELQMRLDDGLDQASTFSDEEAAEYAIRETIKARQTAIDEWIASDTWGRYFDFRVDRPVGMTLREDGEALTDVRDVRVVLRRDPSAESGYFIRTAFPNPD